MSIPPVGPSQHLPSNGGNLMQEYQNLINQFRSLMKKGNTKEIEDCMKSIENFLKANKSALFQLAKQEGWPKMGPEGYETYFDGTIKSIQNYLVHPNAGSLDMTNEAFTQLHWLCTHSSR